MFFLVKVDSNVFGCNLYLYCFGNDKIDLGLTFWQSSVGKIFKIFDHFVDTYSSVKPQHCRIEVFQHWLLLLQYVT